MSFQIKLVLFSCVLAVVQCQVLFVSNAEIELNPFQRFTQPMLEILLAKLKNPLLLPFHGNIDDMRKYPDLMELIEREHSSYVIKDQLDKAWDMAHYLDYYDMPRTINSWPYEKNKIPKRNETNYLLLFQYSNLRDKRQLQENTNADQTFSNSSSPEIKNEPINEIITDPNSPVIYNDTTKAAIIYSSKAPLLSVNGTIDTLGKAASVTLNKRDSYTNVLVTIPLKSGKLVLKFKYQWQSGYWKFDVLEVTTPDSKLYNLTANNNIYASRNFSYHCQGVTTFSNENKEVTLKLFDMQMQPDANNTFGDAYDCVPFITAPIWSGIFVNFVLLSVLSIGIAALMSIKTNDKYENSKSKQLIIAVNEQ